MSRGPARRIWISSRLSFLNGRHRVLQNWPRAFAVQELPSRVNTTDPTRPVGLVHGPRGLDVAVVPAHRLTNTYAKSHANKKTWPTSHQLISTRLRSVTAGDL